VKNKLETIKGTIQKAFPDAMIDYREEKVKLYKFSIDREGRPPCWLYFIWEYLLNNDVQVVLDILTKFNVFDTLSNASEPKWLAVGDFGVKEVDHNYGQGY
jgi:hypothetical protein